MQGVSATTDLPPSSLQCQCGSVDFQCSPRLAKKDLPPPRQCHVRPAVKPRPQPTATPTFQKPQVPPKPPFLLVLGQDKKPKRIPPAPSRPLPAPPPPPKPRPSQTPPGLATQSQREAQSVGLLIERFENSRVPILGVPPRNQLHLCLSMDATSKTTTRSAPDPTAHAPSGSAGAKDSGEPSPADKLALIVSEQTDEVTELRELSCLASLRIDGPGDVHLDSTEDDLNVVHGDRVGCLDNTEREERDSSHELQDNPDSQSSEQNGNGKIPNRDSGIDSPSCAAEGEVFPNEDAIDEEERYDSVTETETSVSCCVTLGNKRDSTQDEDSDLDEVSSGETEGGEKADTHTEVHRYSETQRLLNIARELLHTEEAYVKRLNLLDQVFCTKLTEAGIPQDVITGIFSNISSIYCFHHKFLLPELKTRITGEWDSNPRIGDILQKLAPFMKMYGEYVKNFDRAMDLVNTWSQRSSQFKSVVQNIQKQDVCGNLTLQHHMLEPVQRIPRYELLLKDYLKKLPDDALDRKDTEKALELISTAANHSNAAIRKMEKMNKLLQVYERLGGEEDIVNPANELIKEGHIKKMSAKNGTAQDRYLYLFNNMVLYCVPKLRLMGQKFSVRERIDIAGMEVRKEVQENVKQNLPHTFAIIGKQRSLELQARTAEEKEDWIQVILATIEKHKQNSETFNKAFNSSFSRDEDHLPDSPGPWSNTSVDSDSERLQERKSSKKKEKETCKGCNESFNFTKRKHHCKACGAAICGKCSKMLENKTCRVCPECFETSQGPEGPAGAPVELKRKATAEKQVSLSGDNCLLCAQLQVQEKGKSWTKTWVAITKTEPLVLYLQTSGQDSRGARAIPLPGFEVSVAAPSATEKSELKHAFQLSHSQQALLFSAQDTEVQAKWVELLSRAARGEMPTDTPFSLTEHRESQ
ncbi:FYVE, RhoGEF and PH domain-containing protein 3 isoform X1 [Salmo salar]|uniref:FYVE, RhoGEF and PH domain-containing protein 3 isoform X1 n=2 Tax=Salmo salar TaxID=8030 RepID=A0A1S3MCG6_SALSA|nr:FYVE, RhoGEF and PH domain-containing protein 3-like isoform X1 [Salmo salar]|eukprot:XP_014000898.1 PREDICTED: FYVE, RhoGEF and PH domain-containing protein 3-like isoform X1 [Salmo salar]